MAKRVTVDNLASAIAEILEEYGDEVNQNSEDITKQVAKKGVQALRSASSVFGGTGKYKRGWEAKFEKNRYWFSAKIWNAKVPGLPHLLEYGHLGVNGRRVPGRQHIKPVEDQLTREFISQLEKKL